MLKQEELPEFNSYTATRKQLLLLPKWDGKSKLVFDTLIIIPTRKKHDSGYPCMYFVACVKAVPKMLISGYSDALRFWDWDFKCNIGWNVDCLPCALIQIWPSVGQLMIDGYIGSDCMLKVIPKKDVKQ